MGKKKSKSELGARERQIMDVIFMLGQASVGDVHARLSNAPSYSAVRTMIRLLESKGLLRHTQEGTKYIYSPTTSKVAASKKAISHLIRTFFEGSATDAVAALFGAENLSEADLDKIEDLINDARKEGH